jgi:serine protease Do
MNRRLLILSLALVLVLCFCPVGSQNLIAKPLAFNAPTSLLVADETNFSETKQDLQQGEPESPESPANPPAETSPSVQEPENTSPDAPKKQKAADETQDKKSVPSEDDEDENNKRRGDAEISVPFQMRNLGPDKTRDHSKRSSEMVELFKPLVASAEVSTVKILNGNRLISLGTVVDQQGLILTKASELRGEINCSLTDGRKVSAMVVGVHQETDLALLKVEANDLQPIHWGHDSIPSVGQWIVSPLFDSTQVQVGIVGVDARKIPPSSPYLGIGAAVAGEEEIVGAKIDTVQPKTPADEAQLKVGDIITKIDDVEIKNWDDLRRTLGQYDPKDEITLTVQRGAEELKIKAVLGNKEKLTADSSPVPRQDRSTMQNNMGSRPSQRRKDFPFAFQHDLMLNRFTCGGPVLNLNGQVVGINIARAGRVDSLALPVSTVIPVLELLKSGNLAPAKINQTRLTELEKEWEQVRAKLAAMPAAPRLENSLSVEKARHEELQQSKAELQKAMAELEKRIEIVELKKDNLEKELRSIRSERNTLERRVQSIEREKKSLSTGVN